MHSSSNVITATAIVISLYLVARTLHFDCISLAINSLD